MSSVHRQSGHALILSMILIILMGLLATGGYRSALLESKIIDNQWEYQSAYQRAESAMAWTLNTLIDTHLSSAASVRLPYPSSDYVAPNPGPYPGHDPHDESPATTISLQVIATDGSIAVGRGNSTQHLNSVWTVADITAYNRSGRPAVQLRGVFERGALSQ